MSLNQRETEGERERERERDVLIQTYEKKATKSMKESSIDEEE